MTSNSVEPRAAMEVAELISGAWRSHAIHAAAALGLADLLREEQLGLLELAAKSGSHAPTLGRLLRALASIGIFDEVRPDVFGTTSLGRCLETGALRDAALMMHSDWHAAAWRELVYSIRTGESAFAKAHGTDLFSWLQAHEEAADLFGRAMTAGRSYREVGVIEAYDFSSAELVVDVGGGRGSLLLSILRAHAHLRGILCDLPNVAAAAELEIAKTNMAERCAVVPADFFERVPASGDVYLLAHIVHDWSDDAARQILSRCAYAMAPNGSILLIENVLPANNAPDRTRWLDLEMLVMTAGGRERTAEDFRALASSAGLRLVRVTATNGSRWVIELRRMSREG